MSPLLIFLRMFASVLRIGIAGLLFWLCLQNIPAIRAREALDALPDFDYLAEADRLRGQERYSEALLVLEAPDPAAVSDPVRLQADAAMRERIATEQGDWTRRLGDVGEGALTGRGESVESLTGAVVADLFVFGDVRDLIIEGGKTLRGEDNDEVIVALSAAGIVFTLAPEIDFGTSILKFARKAGALTEALAARIAKMARTAVDEREVAPLYEAVQDVARLGRNARPAGAMTILKHVDDPEELKIAAKLSERAESRFALWVGERPAMELAKAGDGGAALMTRAARKGRAGIEFATTNARLLLAPHPILGLFKGAWKGTLPALVGRVLMQFPTALMGAIAAWGIFEVLSLVSRIVRMRRPGPPARRLMPAVRREPRL